MSAKKKLTSFFETGPVDDLATVDAYKVKKQEVINLLPDKLVNGAESAVARIKKDTGLIKSVAKDLIKISKMDWSKERILADLGKHLGSTPMVKNLTDSVKNSLTAGMSKLGLDNPDLKKMIVIGKDGYKAYKSGDLKSLTGISNLLGKVTGTSDLVKVLDYAAEVATFAVAIEYAITTEIPGLIDDVVGSIKDEVVATKALLMNVGTAFKHSNLKFVDGVVRRVGAGRLLAEIPDAADQLLKYYKSPSFNDPGKRASELNSLVTTLNSLDPDWDTFYRNGIAIGNLGNVTTASKDSHILLQSDDRWAMLSLVAPLYRKDHLKGIFKRSYPKAAI